MPTIAIIGSGLSGKLLALHLLQHKYPGKKTDIVLIDRRPFSDMGPAYSCTEECLLLNVPACRMGAFSTDKGHFYSWAGKQGYAVGEYDFLPRKWYNQYIRDVLHEAESNKHGNMSLLPVLGEVIDMEIADHAARIILKDGTTFIADTVVLAPGNFPPRNLPLISDDYLQNSRYIRNPWDGNVLSSLPSDTAVALIGSGQTSVDMLITLHHRGHRGKILAISRRGHLPLTHTGFVPYPSFYEELKDLKDINLIFKTIRKHFRIAENSGGDANAVIDSLRSHTQELWRMLPEADRRRFLRHLFRYWEMIRSRIAPENMAIIDEMTLSRQLSILSGRIRALTPAANSLTIEYSDALTGQINSFSADLIINTIGPESDYDKVHDELVNRLLQRGLIQPDPLHLGINATPEGNVIHRGGHISEIVYTMGSPLRGILWETVGAPELRDQAELLAGRLLTETA